MIQKRLLFDVDYKNDIGFIPFSNGSEFEYWHERNCSVCDKYENKSTNRDNAKCQLAFDIDYSMATGYIPLSTANHIGIKNGNLSDCFYKEIDFYTVEELHMEVFLQLDLFKN